MGKVGRTRTGHGLGYGFGHTYHRERFPSTISETSKVKKYIAIDATYSSGFFLSGNELLDGPANIVVVPNIKFLVPNISCRSLTVKPLLRDIWDLKYSI